MIRQKTLVITGLSLFILLSCGIEELYYLPQIPESLVTTDGLNTEATINIPPNLLNQVDYSYATGYVIFYKIYIGSTDNTTITDILSNTRISSDYYSLSPFTDPVNTSSITLLNTFSNRGFYELVLEGTEISSTVLSKSGGNFSIQFDPIPGTKPSIVFNGNKYPLFRSIGKEPGRTPFTPKPDRYFLNSPDLENFENAQDNADVSVQSGVSGFAYASMYIVAVGTSPSSFQRIYGKPTHITIFKLPQIN